MQNLREQRLAKLYTYAHRDGSSFVFNFANLVNHSVTSLVAILYVTNNFV